MNTALFRMIPGSLEMAACLGIVACLPPYELHRFSKAMSPVPGSRPESQLRNVAGTGAPAPEYSEGLAAVKAGGFFGYRDTAGRMAVAPRFDHAGPFSGGRAAVLIGSKWGYIDRDGREAIPPAFDWAGTFREGRAAVAEAGICRFVDTAGDSVGRFAFAEARPFSGGLAAVRFGDADGGAWGFIDARGSLAIPPLFADVPRGFSGGYAAVTIGGEGGRRMGFIDTSGGFAMDCLFDAAGDFSEGVAPVSGGGGDCGGGSATWRYVDATGARAIPGDWAWAGSFREGRALVRGSAGDFRVIDRAGSVIAGLPGSSRPAERRSGGQVTYVLPKSAMARDGRRDDSSRWRAAAANRDTARFE